MNETINLILESNIINFIIVAAIIVFTYKKLRITKKFENLTQETENYVEASKNEKLSAEEGLEKINNKVEKLPALIERIKQSAKHNVDNIVERIKQETEVQKLNIENTSKKIIDFETKKFNSKLIKLLSEKSVELARENAVKELEGNRELHNFYIENAIEELEKVSL